MAMVPVHAQQFVNGDLEGVVAGQTSVIPGGWQAVPESDPACEATEWYGATPDLTEADGPLPDNGLMGNPHSGLTFVTGLHAFGSHHEGLMQSVSGFTVGCTYTVGLYQTVCKQINSDALDPTGSWSVYADNTLLGVTATTTSNEPAISLNKPWERREVTLTATATTHLIKFMPTDDDADIISNGVRMGIDSVWIEASLPGGTVLADLGNDTTLCAGATLLLDPGTGTTGIVWQDGSTGDSFEVSAAGTYWVQVSIGCAVDSDTIIVAYTQAPFIDLGPDLELCPGDEAIIEANGTGYEFLWSDGSTGTELTVTPPGLYWLQATNACGSVRDTIEVALSPVPVVNLGPDHTLCTPGTALLNVQQDGAVYLWSDGSDGPELLVASSGVYSVTVSIGNCTTSDEVTITYEDCAFELELPNVFSPNGSGVNDLFEPISSRGISSMRTTIFNRWGQVVYNTTNIGIRWDGRTGSGEPVPEGTYFYELEFTPKNGDPAVRTGSLTLLR